MIYKHPHKCVVCEGKGTLDSLLQIQGSSVQHLITRKCKTCKGTGIMLAKSSNPVEEQVHERPE